MMAHVLFGIAFELRRSGELVAARQTYEQSRLLFLECGDGLRVSKDNTDLAGIAIEEGRYAEARKLCEEALPYFRRLRFSLRDEPLWMLEVIAIIEGNYADAKAWYTECLLFDQEIGVYQQFAECLIGFASIANFEKRFERAARLVGWAEAEVEARQDPLEKFDKAELERLITALRARLGDSQFEGMASKGHAMTPDQVIAFALERQDE